MSTGHVAGCICVQCNRSADAVLAHVPIAAPRVGGLAGLPVVLSRVAEVLSRVAEHIYLAAGSVILPQHSVAAEAAVTAELVACTLGQRVRPELLTRET